MEEWWSHPDVCRLAASGPLIVDLSALQGSPDDVIQMVVALLSLCTPPAGQTVKTPCINFLVVQR